MANEDIEAARTYHEVTKHSYTSVRSGAYSLDWDNKPLPYKIYPETAAIALPRDLSLSPLPTLEAIAGGGSTTKAALDLAALGRILFCAGGLTRHKRVGDEDYHFRAAASAGALYPIEIYVASGEIEGLGAGLYHFSPADLKLRGLRRGDWRATIAAGCAMDHAVREASAILVLSAIFWRSAWKYRARAYRYCFWDAGTMLANLLPAAAAEGLEAELLTAFVDPELERLLGIDGEREGVVCVVALGKASTPAEAAALEPVPLKLETVPLSGRETAYDDLIKMHRASKLLTIEEARRIGAATLDLEPAPPTEVTYRPDTIELINAAALGATILRRGSTRAFARESIDDEVLGTIMALSSGHPRADFPRLTDTYLIVNAVEGLEPGAYYYSRERQSFDLLKAGDFRGEAGYLCLEQDLGADASVLVCYMADLQRVLRALGNRGYRDAHLEAGLLAGRAYLAAYSLEHGATGLTFYDDDTTQFFAPHAAAKSPLLMVAIGVPRTAAAG